nr:riboflavin synthase [Ipomoea batatas]
MAALSISSLSSSSSKPLNLIKSLRTPPILNLQTQQWLPSLTLKKPISIHSLKPHPLSLRFTQHRKPHLLYSSGALPASISATIVRIHGRISPETLQKTSLSELEHRSLVNFERALTPNSRMGGHFVQSHVDGTGVILGLDPEGDLSWVKVKTTKELIKYIVPKGFIVVDETSLIVVNMFDDECWICLTMTASTSCWESKV